MSKSVLRNKAFEFALRIIKIGQRLCTIQEYVLSKQIVRSGTSIGALIHEAQFAESTKDFIHKLYIALKEANETDYWLNLIQKAYPELAENIPLTISDCKEIKAILIASINSQGKAINISLISFYI